MQEDQVRRKPRIPLSPEELFYFKKIKQLKEQHKIQEFKATVFYKIINRINIVLAGFLSYCILSMLVCCYWQTAYVLKATCSFGEFNRNVQKRTITEIEITTTDGQFVPLKTSELYRIPQPSDIVYIGRDFIFDKIIKAKFAYDSRSFWHFYTFPAFTVSVFALCMGFFVYKVNKHLSTNGLLTVFGLFILASLYFVLI